MTDNYERKDDAMIYRIDQKLDDFIKRFDEHLELSQDVKKDHENRLAAAETVLAQINKPMKAIGWAVTIFISGGLVWLGEKVVSFLVSHWK